MAVILPNLGNVRNLAQIWTPTSKHRDQLPAIGKNDQGLKLAQILTCNSDYIDFDTGVADMSLRPHRLFDTGPRTCHSDCIDQTAVGNSRGKMAGS